MKSRTCLSIILAAGDGTRMKSAVPKVLHPVAGAPMIAHVVKTTAAAGAAAISIVTGRGGEEVSNAVAPLHTQLDFHQQMQRLGTGHAVLATRDAIARGFDDVLIVFGDTPLVTAETLLKARAKLADGAAVTVMGFQTESPSGYGRLIEENGRLIAIREEKDCNDEERKITFCNGGLMGISGQSALELLEAIGNDNAKGEYYLTDVVEIAHAKGLRVEALEVPFEELLGINNRAELAGAESIWQQRKREELMHAGVSMQAPETIYLSYDTAIGADSTIEPHVWFGPGVKIGNSVRVRAYSHIEGAAIADGAEVGPYARLRPGTQLASGSKVGNFCEIKKASLGEGAKVNHLTYIGDASIGAKANVGAGTITCNYDGHNKYRTSIGDGAFVGSNSTLIAPLNIGHRAFVAAGSVITQDVPDEALAFGRSRDQTVREGKAAEINKRNAARKKEK